MFDTRQEFNHLIDQYAGEFDQLSQYIYDHPELQHKEYKSSQAHVDLLRRHGFQVDYPYMGIETAFRAEYQSDKEGPTLAYLSEYDALPGIGHGCGHNLLGATTTGTGIIMRYLVDHFGGRVVVLGTPAEETEGAKVDMAAGDTFDDIDVAFCTHPADQYFKSESSLSMEAIEFTYYGKTAHAAQAPWEAINALDGVVSLYNSVSLYRHQMRPTSRIHGVISDGGQAANVIPDKATIQFYVRDVTLKKMNQLHDKMLAMAEAAAMATGTRMEWRHYEYTYHDLITNQVLSDRFNQRMSEIGIEMVDREGSVGSLDMGNVSHVVPVINPYFSMTGGQPVTGHTREFRDYTLTESGKQGVRNMIYGLVTSSLDLIRDKDLMDQVQAEFQATDK